MKRSANQPNDSMHTDSAFHAGHPCRGACDGDRYARTVLRWLRTRCGARLSPFLLVLMLIGKAWAQVTPDFIYTVSNGAVTITQYQGPGGAVVVPGSINQLPVTAIGDYAFPLYSASQVSSIALPKTLSSIGAGGFYGCTSLTAVTVDPLSTTYMSADGILFSKDQTAIVAFPQGRAGTYSIPDTVAIIGDDAFYHCAKLTGVTIPNSVTNIGERSFGECAELASVTIGNGVASIGGHAFEACESLTSISIPDSVTTISNGIPRLGGAFSFCSGLTNVTLGNGLTNVGDYAFIYCGSLASFTIPDSVVRVGVGALLDCTSLTNVLIGEGVTNLDLSFVAGSSSLAAIDVNPLNLAYSSRSGVLFDKSQLALLVYPPAKPGSYAIPESVTSIAASGFANAYGLTNVTFGNAVTNLGKLAFFGCSGLASVALPDSLTTIADSAFEGCSNLTRATLGKEVTSIGSWAFALTGLTNITIPSSVGSLGELAFYECFGLVGVFFEGNAPSYFEGIPPNPDGVVFNASTNAIIYYLPGTTGWGPSFAGRPAVLWNPQALTSDGSFGVRQNRFGFNISGTPDIPLVVEASTNGAAGSWISLQSSTLTNGSIYFSDTQWTNYPSRFYRIRSP